MICVRLVNKNNNLSNEIKYCTHSVLYSVILLFVSGAIFQTYLLEHGVHGDTVNKYFSIMQIVQTVIMLLFSRLMDGFKRVIGFSTFSFALSGVLLAFMLIFNNVGFGSSTITLLFVFGLIFNIGYGFYTILCYKMPYHVFDINKYGKITATTGWLSGILSVLISTLMTFFQKKYKFNSVMLVALIFIVFLLVVFILVSLTIKKINCVNETKIEKVKINIFTYKPFYILSIPNLFRGFCAGIIMLIVTVGYHSKLLDSKSATTIVTISNVVMIVSCMLYSFIARHLGEHRMIMISSVGIVVGLPLMFVFGKTIWFLAFYGIVYFLFNIINYAVPTAVTQMVSYEVMGQYTAWRMLLHTFGTSIAGFVCTPMLNYFGSIVTMIVAGGLQLVSGLVYYFYMKYNVICLENKK